MLLEVWRPVILQALTQAGREKVWIMDRTKDRAQRRGNKQVKDLY